MDNSKLEALFQNPPKMHFMNDQWVLGGFGPEQLRKMIDAFRSVVPQGGSVAETGAGLSTLAFLASGANRVISIAPSGDLFDRIERAADEFGISTGKLEKHKQFSEIALPGITLNSYPFLHFALIDGGHNFTSAWVDFTYFNYVLVKGGIIVVDDIGIFSCSTLFEYLNDSKNWEDVWIGKKFAMFRKLADQRLEPDFGASHYILNNSRK